LVGNTEACAALQRLCRAAHGLTGVIFLAEEGLPLGLIDEVVAKGEGLTRANALAADIAKRGR